ncbi:MAG: penicillin-binding transpeptidase domain-containing protein [Rhodothermales bacterium]
MRLLFLALLLAGCAEPPADPPPPAEPALAHSTADLAAFFPDSTEGAFVLYDAQTGVTTRYNPERAAERRTPASTFKIFNSLVALDAGAVADEHEIVEWDGVDRGSAGWNESQDLETAFQRSSVWVYRELARRVGRDTLQAALDREGYGNASIGDEVDLFWLDGSLRISPDEQVAFLRRLQAGETGFSDRAEAIVKRIMIADTTAGAVVRGKTGWARSEEENLGWWVGWIEQGEGVHFFATLVESDDPEYDLLAARRATTDRILRHLGVR